MSKAVLVLPEMPENCADCRLEDSEYNICKPTYKDVPFKSRFEPERPDWCPLRTLPEKYNSSYDTDYGVGYIRGWNDAIEAIEGSEEDA